MILNTLPNSTIIPPRSAKCVFNTSAKPQRCTLSPANWEVKGISTNGGCNTAFSNVTAVAVSRVTKVVTGHLSEASVSGVYESHLNIARDLNNLHLSLQSYFNLFPVSSSTTGLDIDSITIRYGHALSNLLHCFNGDGLCRASKTSIRRSTTRPILWRSQQWRKTT